MAAWTGLGVVQLCLTLRRKQAVQGGFPGGNVFLFGTKEGRKGREGKGREGRKKEGKEERREGRKEGRKEEILWGVTVTSW